jgi:acyl carrier protein
MQVEIMMALEEKFGMDLDEEQAVKITTVQEAADLIAEQVGA